MEYDGKRCAAGWSSGAKNFCFSLEYFNKLPKLLSKKEKEKFSLLKKGISGNQIDIYEISYGKILAKKVENKSELDRIALRKKRERELRRSFKGVLPNQSPVC